MMSGRMFFPCEARSLSLLCCGCGNGYVFQDEEGRQDTGVILKDQEENRSSLTLKIILMPVNKMLEMSLNDSREDLKYEISNIHAGL